MSGVTDNIPPLPQAIQPLRRPPYYNDLVKHLADSTDLRTLKQFCDDNGVNPNAVYSYMHNHRDDVYAAADKIRAKYIPMLRSAALKACFANVDKSFQDRQLILRITGDLIETNKSELTFRTPDEKRAAIAQIMAALSDKLAGKRPGNAIEQDSASNT